MTATIPRACNLSVPQVRDLIADDPRVRIIDVRTGGEFETMHIPGSFNIPLDTLHEHASELADLDLPIVLVCQSGARATKAQGALASEGCSRSVTLLEGGIAAWQAAGGDLVHGSTDRWAMDRQVRLAAGSLALAAVVASVFVPKAKWLAAGVGAGLTFSAVTNTCAMANMLGKLPYNRSDSCDITAVLDEIRSEQKAA